jgi:hypothetical protein
MGVQWFKGSIVQWFKGSRVQWFKGSMVQGFNAFQWGSPWVSAWLLAEIFVLYFQGKSTA